MAFTQTQIEQIRIGLNRYQAKVRYKEGGLVWMYVKTDISSCPILGRQRRYDDADYCELGAVSLKTFAAGQNELQMPMLSNLKSFLLHQHLLDGSQFSDET